MESNAGVGNKRGIIAFLEAEGWVGLLRFAEKHALPAPCPATERWGTRARPHPMAGEALPCWMQHNSAHTETKCK